MSEPPVRILLVEDNPGDARLLREGLRESGSRFELVHADHLAEALRLLRNEPFHVVLLDLSLPDASGLDTFEQVFRQAPTVPIVVLTGMADEEMAVRTVQEGAQDYLVKGEADPPSLVRALRYAMERKRSQEALREITTLQQAILDSANYSVISTDAVGTIRTFNACAERLLGYAAAEVVGRESPLLFHDMEEVRRRAAEFSLELGTAVPAAFEVFTVHLRGGGPDEREWTYVRKDGARFPVMLSVTALRDPHGVVTGYLGIASDITERKRAEDERDRLWESERKKGEQLKLAIREAHHRIKNNLQAISDLLYLEVASQGGGSPEDVLRETVERIQSIALVHDLLSQEEDVQTVDIHALAERLVPMVLRGAPGAGRAAVELEVPSVLLSSKRATTLALILNELVSNAAKHALGENPSPRLRIRLAVEDEGLALRVADNGPGLPPGFDVDRDAHVGLQVVRTLAERDLGGKLTLAGSAGLEAVVWFPW